MKSSKGFTLIELMITVAVIGILAGIAYPSYQDSVMKSRRRDAQGALVGLANAMERHFTETNSYAGSADANDRPTIFAIQSPVDGGTAAYELFITSVTATTFTLEASPTGAQANDRCGNLTLTNTGARGFDGANGNTEDCW
ncbi:type IV pilin protein [Methylomonas sp. SURF-2]|uniref:Type IV pilin protein n=1 Tax=Methylomonas subterranea TaxID=2952225 RepID=A0ABT1TID1_9GAMM|nr:type IV pilin protein [Methylomonas sp. SURF-2]MCQ8105215.1 type IV pilin protein [Methylomonas sp. SURF-2]